MKQLEPLIEDNEMIETIIIIYIVIKIFQNSHKKLFMEILNL